MDFLIQYLKDTINDTFISDMEKVVLIGIVLNKEEVEIKYNAEMLTPVWSVSKNNYWLISFEKFDDAVDFCKKAELPFTTTEG